jgi:hypothetical protein
MIKYLLLNHIHITYYLALFLPFIAMGPMKFSQPFYTSNGYFIEKN